MTHTIRWYQIPKKIKKLPKNTKLWMAKEPWKYVNPFYYRHDYKLERIRQHRVYRHKNKIRVNKGMDILHEPHTNGRLSH